MLLAHEVHGQDTATLAASERSTPGAIAARLSRTRAKLRVEYCSPIERTEPRRIAAARFSWRSPRVTAAASGSSTPAVTC
jgi:hypothetical protein